MVDYTIATQVRPFQMPNVAQLYGAAQDIQMNRMRMAEAQETAQERNALRGLLSSGVDPYSTEGLAQVRRVAPMLAAPFEQAAGQRAYQTAQAARLAAQTQADQIKTARDLLSGVTNQAQWDAWRQSTVAALPQYANVIPREFSPQNVQRMAEGAEGVARRLSEATAAARPNEFERALEAAGIRRGTPEYQAAMRGRADYLSGARPTPPAAREQRITDTMTTFGVDRATALGIVDDIIVVVPGSAGEPPAFLNKLTNEMITPRMGAARPEGPAIDLRRPQAAAPAAPTNMMLSGATGAPAPASVEDFYAERRQRQVQQAGQTAEAQARGQAVVRDEGRPARVQEAGETTEAQARAQAVVRGEEQPARVEEAGQTAEAQARARATVEQEEETRKRRRGQEQLESTLRDMMTQYQELRRLGGITSSAEGSSLSNIPAFVSGTRIGQMGGRAVATPSQTARDQIESLRNQLLQAFKGATGMTGRETDSNQDVQRLLAAVSDTTMSIEAVYGILRSFSQRYGLGELVIPEAPPPAAAPSRDQTPGPRRGAAPPAAPAAGARPTLEQFLGAARRANPNVSDEDLTSYYNRTYGGR